MLTEQDLIAYLENTLSPAERQHVEAELERDPQQRRQLVRQIQLDAALRATFAEASANERVKHSILAVVRGETEAAIKQHVLHDTTFMIRSSRREETQTSRPSSIFHLLSAAFRRPAWAFSVAAACLAVFLGVWFATRPAPLALAIETPTQVALSSGSIVPKAGDTLCTEDSASASVKFADGTIIHLEPETEICFEPVANPPRAGGKQFTLISGSLSADVAKQPDGLPLLIKTPHALITVVGTEFDLTVGTNQTELEVTRGLVKMTRSNLAQPVNVAAGEFAVASPEAVPRFGALPRNPYLWPFSSTSPWNTPIGSGAKYEPLPVRALLADGSLTDAVRSRRPFMGWPTDPLRNIWVNGQLRGDVLLGDVTLPPAGSTDSLVLMQRARRYVIEARGVTMRPNGDLEATDTERTDLAGPGMSPGAVPAKPFGLSSLGGLIRAGEYERGIPHALSARVNRERLGGRRNFATPATVWPAVGGDVSDTGFLSVGALLAIPPDVNIREVVGDSGPAYELARAMQDYGVYVTGFIDAPFVLVAGEARLDRDEEDAMLNKLVPLLKMVTNNSPATPAGGGTPRREPAPAFPGER